MARGKGEGGLSFDKANEVWVGSVELPSTWDDEKKRWKRNRRTVSSKNKKAAAKKLQGILREVEQGNLSTRKVKVSTWVDYWLTQVAPKKINPNTIRSYRSALKRVTERYGDKELGCLTPQRIREMTADVAQLKSASTARNLHSYLSHCLADAVGDGLLAKHPMEHLSIPKRAKTLEKAFEVEQAVNLLKWLGRQIDEQTKHAQLAPLWIAYLLTGARKGEMLGLEPERVSDHIDVTWQLQRLKHSDVEAASDDYEYRHLESTFYLVRPKSKSGWRSYPLVEPLKSIIEAIAGDTPHGRLVFRRPDGKPWDPDMITDLWYEMLVAADIESSDTPTKDRVNVHGARHTVADLLDLLGVPESVIMDILGHSTRHMSRSYRTKQSPAVKSAMASVSELLRTGKTPHQLPQ